MTILPFSGYFFIDIRLEFSCIPLENMKLPEVFLGGNTHRESSNKESEACPNFVKFWS